MTRIRVLHVDDEPEFTELTARSLREHRPEFDLATVESVEEALDLLATDRIDCVVSEYDLPERTGLDLLRTVREESSDLPVIFFTGTGSEEIASEAIHAGVTEYLRKETGSDQYTVLANRIVNAVSRHRTETTLEDDLHEDIAALRALHAVATTRELPFEKRVISVLDLGRDVIGVDAGFFTHIHEDTQDILAAKSEIETIAAGVSGPLDEAYCRYILENDRVTTVMDAAVEMADNPAYEAFGLACYIGAPVTVDGEHYGTICFAGTEPREMPFSVFQRTFVGLLAEWLGYELGQRRAKVKLERQNDRLEEFASVVSHDLRSPLSVAQGYLGLAREVGDDRHFDRVASALDRMNTIIEDVLAMARLGGHVEAPISIDLATLAREAWTGVDTGTATIDIEEMGTVEGDEKRVLRLFENLFRNCVKHGDDPVAVRVGPFDTGFYVEDDGPGIPEDVRDRIFEGGYTTTEEGTGFGLSIVKEIAEAHGWSVTITEAERGGARFEFGEHDPDLVHE